MMSPTMIGIGFSAAFLVFAVPTAVFLLRAYSRSRMSGFLWLLGAVVVWPFVARGTSLMMGMIAAGTGARVSSLMAVNLIVTVIGGVLLLVAVIILDRELEQRIAAAQVVPPPPTVLP